MPCKTILIVEDDEDIRTALADVLEMEGYVVLQATNGKEAVQILNTICSSPCLILLDLMMPVMSGWEFLELKNKNIQLASIPVTVMSAVANSIEGKPGVAKIMRKPIDIDNLVTIVKLYCAETNSHI